MALRLLEYVPQAALKNIETVLPNLKAKLDTAPDRREGVTLTADIPHLGRVQIGVIVAENVKDAKAATRQAVNEGLVHLLERARALNFSRLQAALPKTKLSVQLLNSLYGRARPFGA